MVVANCLSCRLAAKADGGDGKCPRSTSYAELRELLQHDCPLFRRRPKPRPKSEVKQEGLF